MGSGNWAKSEKNNNRRVSFQRERKKGIISCKKGLNGPIAFAPSCSMCTRMFVCISKEMPVLFFMSVSYFLLGFFPLNLFSKSGEVECTKRPFLAVAFFAAMSSVARYAPRADAIGLQIVPNGTASFQVIWILPPASNMTWRWLLHKQTGNNMLYQSS